MRFLKLFCQVINYDSYIVRTIIISSPFGFRFIKKVQRMFKFQTEFKRLDYGFPISL